MPTSCASPSGASTSSPTTRSNGSASVARSIRRRVDSGRAPSGAARRARRRTPDRTTSRSVSWRCACPIPGAVLSHASAAALLGDPPGAEGPGRGHRAPRARGSATCEPVVHYSNRMPDHHVVELVDGGRVTSVARTVFDLGGVLDEQGHLSVDRGRPQQGSVHRCRARRGVRTTCAAGVDEARRRGSGSPTSTERAGRPTMSELELELQEALVAAGLPPAVQQHPVDAAERPDGLPRPRLPRLPPRHRGRPLGVARHADRGRAGQGARPRAGAARLGAPAVHRADDRAAARASASRWSAPCSTLRRGLVARRPPDPTWPISPNCSRRRPRS